MPHLVKFLLRHAAIGCAVAALFVGALVVFDIAHLGTLAAAAPDGPIALTILTLAVSITFGSVQMGFAVMLMGDHGSDTAGRRRPAIPRVAQPVPAMARRRE